MRKLQSWLAFVLRVDTGQGIKKFQSGSLVTSEDVTVRRGVGMQDLPEIRFCIAESTLIDQHVSVLGNDWEFVFVVRQDLIVECLRSHEVARFGELNEDEDVCV